MSTATMPAPPAKKRVKQTAGDISRAQFLEEYADRADGYKYEWNHGKVEKTEAMNQQQTTLFLLLTRIFVQTGAFKSGGGLTCETDMDTTPMQLRRPDIAFYSGEQIERMKKGEKQVAPWLAEVISPTDRAEDIYSKLGEYFRAGVQVVWHIFPHNRQVHVYNSPENVLICSGATLCNGAPVLPDFQISANELFA